MSDIKSMTLEELQEWVVSVGEKKFRAAQLYDWMHKKKVAGYGEMTNLSAAFREKCGEIEPFVALKTVRVQESKLDGTKKYLFELPDGNLVESVWMKYKHGNSVCISSQAGCRMGCTFCASTLGGLRRNLLPSEMLDQVYRIENMTGERVSNVVVMGIGEPLDNYDNLVRFIKLLTDENGLHISQRNVTVSTCGLVPEMLKLADEGLQITLALSLHAATDEKRRKLMPVAKRYSIRKLADACTYYFDRTGRRMTLEYALIKDVNDTKQDAEDLAQLAFHLHCHVNLIPVNPVRERGYTSPKKERVETFRKILERGKVQVTVRRELGRDIDGACGQLRQRQQ